MRTEVRASTFCSPKMKDFPFKHEHGTEWRKKTFRQRILVLIFALSKKRVKKKKKKRKKRKKARL